MKKVFLTQVFFILCSVFMILPVESYADALAERRNKCSIFTKRFRVYVRTQGNDDIDIFPCKTSRSSCNGIDAECESNDRDTGTNRRCARAYAFAAEDADVMDEWVFPGSGCTAGLGISNLSSHMIKSSNIRYLSSKQKQDFAGLHYEANSKIDEVKKTYSVNRANGYLIVPKLYPGIVEIQFTLWKAEDDEVNGIADENMTEEKILLQEYIRIKDNRVEISEGLKGKKSIKVIEDKDFISVELSDFSHTFNIPDGVDIEHELVARVSGFTEFDDERFLNEALAKSSQAPMFDLVPNPNNGKFIIGVNSPSSNERVQIKLFDAQGSYVRTLFNGILNNENGQIEIETGGLANGIYFITIVGNGIIETKKVIITQ